MPDHNTNTPELHLKITLCLYNQDEYHCFGPGIAELLERVQMYASLRAAAASMEMAYSKAWRIIRTAEKVFSCKLLLSTIGGKNGGGAKLTPEAEKILSEYRAFQAEVNAFAQEKFEKHFADISDNISGIWPECSEASEKSTSKSNGGDCSC